MVTLKSMIHESLFASFPFLDVVLYILVSYKNKRGLQEITLEIFLKTFDLILPFNDGF